MALKKDKGGGGAPEWVLTYGDMMSLLLCFFILLASFADFEQGGSKENITAAIQSIQQALGVDLQGNNSIKETIDFNSIVEKLQWALKTSTSNGSQGDVNQQGVKGKHFRLRRIRDGMEISMGGPVMFEPLSAELTPEGRAAIKQIADTIKGHRNKIDIHGHAGDYPLPDDWGMMDVMRLSYQRAQSVAEELTRQGVDPRVFRLVAVGPNEPVSKEVFDREQRDANRRVEVIIRESLVDDYVGRKDVTTRPASRSATAQAAG